jgi:Fic family protein
MKIPHKPPTFEQLTQEAGNMGRFDKVLSVSRTQHQSDYLHWDKLRRKTPPGDLNNKEWWLATKLSRLGNLRNVELIDRNGTNFKFLIPDFIHETLHKIDLLTGGTITVPEPITNQNTKDKYLIRSLIEEAITSSQLEGAATTREVAKELIKSGRKPRDTSERMILNNFLTMQRIRQLRDRPLTPALIYQVHKLVTEKTLPNPDAAGRTRNADEPCVVTSDTGKVYHEPPPADELEVRLKRMCDFANSKHNPYFIHPVIRAIILHFWLAYDHPFVDGNGRTARALFYWSMLNSGYWLFEFISISTILRKAPVSYARSFLYTETDDNDVTYFIVAQSKVIVRSIDELYKYIERKTEELREVESHLKSVSIFNNRQLHLIKHALKHPGFQYTIQSHKKSHNVAYQTARTDLLSMVDTGLFEFRKIGKALILIPLKDLPDTLLKLERESAASQLDLKSK